MKYTKLAIGFILFIYSIGGWCNFDGKALKDICEDENTQLICQAYIRGAIDGFTMSSFFTENSDSYLKSHNELSYLEIRLNYLKFIDQHPKTENYPAAYSLMEVLKDIGYAIRSNN